MNFYKLTNAQVRYVAFKRWNDAFIATILLLLLSPLMLIIALFIKLSSPKDRVIFKQERMGKDNKKFVVYKFRTMRSYAPPDCPSEGIDAEKYLEKYGKLFRRTSIDEFPQLFNVVCGDMSIIGPRPLVEKEPDIHQLRSMSGVYALRPGITGLAQVSGRDRVTPQEKARFDYEYLKTVSLKTDIKLLAKTVTAVLGARDVVEGTSNSNK